MLEYGYSTRMNWPEIIATLPPGLSSIEVSRRLNRHPRTVHDALTRYGYAATDGRHAGQLHRRKLDPDKVDWSRPLVEIAREWGVSKQCAHQALARRKAKRKNS